MVEENKNLRENLFPVKGIHHLHLYVGNAKQSCYYFAHAFGFQPIAYRGLETGQREQVSYVLAQGEMRIVLTGTLSEDTEVARAVHLHGDGVADIALEVSDVEQAFQHAVAAGAEALQSPTIVEDEQGRVKLAVIKAYGDTVHTLIEKMEYPGLFLPGYEALKMQWKQPHTGLYAIDHVVANVERMEEWVAYYEKVMGFDQMIHFDDEDISTEYSALMSKVMHDGGRIKFPINEPAEGKRKSQIQEYLDYYKGPGVQHIALLTDDIIQTVRILREQGVQFLATPASYYDVLQERVGSIDESIEELRELHILVDRDDEGYLLQIFTQPVVDRPTLFFEIIQRKGARGFGEGNFKALFESIEREQAKRGNL